MHNVLERDDMVDCFTYVEIRRKSNIAIDSNSVLFL